MREMNTNLQQTIECTIPERFGKACAQCLTSTDVVGEAKVASNDVF